MKIGTVDAASMMAESPFVFGTQLDGTTKIVQLVVTSAVGAPAAAFWTGGAGDDNLTGSGGSDTLYGGDGNDQLFGDAADITGADQGNDHLPESVILVFYVTTPFQEIAGF